MRSRDQELDDIRKALKAVKSIADDLTIPLVANLKSSIRQGADYNESSVSTEYFSENEASQILVGLEENGFYSKLYVGEIEFIKAVLSGAFFELPRSRKLIYNTAQSGTGAGRKSLVPAFCALNNIPICNSNPYVLSLARHKFHVFCILRNLGFPAPESWLYDANAGWLLERRPPEGLKLVAKACFESASIGLTSDAIGEVSPAYEDVLRKKSIAFRQPFIVQKFISGWEVEVPLFDLGGGPFALEPVSITLSGDPHLGDQILDYDIIYDDNYGFGPSDHLAIDIRRQIKRTAECVFLTLGIEAIGRVDFRIAADGTYCVTDVATTPHLIKHSSFAFAFERAGFVQSDVLGAVVAANARRHGWC